jgi:hypothetical protein
VLRNTTLKVVRDARVESARAAGHDVDVRFFHGMTVPRNGLPGRPEKQIPRRRSAPRNDGRGCWNDGCRVGIAKGAPGGAPRNGGEQGLLRSQWHSCVVPYRYGVSPACTKGQHSAGGSALFGPSGRQNLRTLGKFVRSFANGCSLIHSRVGPMCSEEETLFNGRNRGFSRQVIEHADY